MRRAPSVRAAPRFLRGVTDNIKRHVSAGSGPLGGALVGWRHENPRASNFIYLVMGALSVAIVAGVLAASGVFDTLGRLTPRRAPSTATRGVLQLQHVQLNEVQRLRAHGRRPTSTGSPPASCTSRHHQPRARPPGPASCSAPTARSSPTITSSRARPRCSVRFGENGDADPRQARRRRPVHGPRRAQGRPDQGPGRPQAAHARQLQQRSSPGEPAIAIGSPFGLVGHRHHRHRLRARPRDPVAERLPDLRRRSRPTPRSTPATPAARCSTRRAA